MIIDLGLIDYQEAYKIQKEFVRRRRLGEIEDSIIVAEHNSVFTIGSRGSKENIRVSKDFLERLGIWVLDVDRGGDITFHGPGQILVYPILDLRHRGKDLHRYLRDLESVVIGLLNEYGITGSRIKGKTGVWVSGKKIASIGIAASDWVTYHGLSLNVKVDLSYFSMIYPCGMKDAEITSMKTILGRDMAMPEVKGELLSQFKRVFELKRRRP